MTKQTKKNAKEKQDNPAKKEEEIKTSKQVESQSTSQEEELILWKDKCLRLYAEFDNYKKRVAKEQISFMKMASEVLILKLLPIVENLHRALHSNEKEDKKGLRQGIELIYDDFINILTKEGLSPMSIQQGDSFDPDYHQALSTAPTDDTTLKEKIVQVVSRGYMLGDKVIKTAKVIIGQ